MDGSVLDRVDHRRLGVSILAGAGAFLAGYAASVLLVAGRVGATETANNASSGVVQTLFPPLWKVAAWAFYGTHGAPARTLVDPESEAAIAGKILFWMYRGNRLSASYEFSGGTSAFVPAESASHNVAEVFLDWPLWPLALGIPAILLLCTGFALGRRYGKTIREGATAGVTVVVGYGPLAVAGVLLTRATLSIYGETTVLGPSLGPAVLLAGVLYPVGFGALGGALATGFGAVVRRKVIALLMWTPDDSAFERR